MFSIVFVKLVLRSKIYINNDVFDLHDKVIVHIEVVLRMVHVQVFLEILKAKRIPIFKLAVVLQVLLESIVGQMH